jgi:hypothetical protein
MLGLTIKPATRMAKNWRAGRLHPCSQPLRLRILRRQFQARPLHQARRYPGPLIVLTYLGILEVAPGRRPRERGRKLVVAR